MTQSAQRCETRWPRPCRGDHHRWHRAESSRSHAGADAVRWWSGRCRSWPQRSPGTVLIMGVPTAVLSRGVAGVAGRTLIVNLPGSSGGARDGMAVLGPVLSARRRVSCGVAITDMSRSAWSSRRMDSPGSAASVGTAGRSPCGTAPVVLAPLRHRDRGAWERVRRENAELAAAVGGDAAAGLAARAGDVRGSGAVRSAGRPGRDGCCPGWSSTTTSRVLEAAAGRPADGQRDRRRLGVVGSDRLLGRPAAGGPRDHPDGGGAGRRLLLPGDGPAPDRDRDPAGEHRSLRVVAKLGFRPEGLRPRYLHIDGDWRDHLVFALNAEEVPEGLLQRWDNLRQPVKSHIRHMRFWRHTAQDHEDGVSRRIRSGCGDDRCDLCGDRHRLAGLSRPAFRPPS